MKPVTRVDVPPVRRVQAWFRRAFGGCTWQGIGLIATLCVLNALRKMGFELDRSLHGWKPFLGWVRMTAFEATLGCVVAVPVALAVVAVSNLGPREPRRRLAAYVIAILLSWMILGEVPTPLMFLGGALCLLGVLVTRLKWRRAPEA